MNITKPRSVAVIGAGIVGLCVAYYARKAGFDVTLIDPEMPGSQCTSGNAGAIAPGAVAPLAMPGVVASGPTMLLDPTSPLHLPASYAFQVAPWLLRFIAAARPQKVNQIASALHMLLKGAVQMHQELATEVGCPHLIRDNGQIHLYPDRESMRKDDASWGLKRDFGLKTVEIGETEIRELEPAIGENYKHGYYLPDQGWIAEPYRYANAIATALREQGVRFVQAKTDSFAPSADGWTVRCGASSVMAEHIVIAAGAWSANMLRTLRIRVPLETQRGYHVHFAKPTASLSRTVALADRKVFMTPMETGLRVAGTVEFGGLTRPPTERRAALLAVHAKAGLPDLDIAAPSTWMGHRPCLPDSMPVIGPVPGHRGLWCAFGHGHLGMTGSVNTGQLLAQGLSGTVPPGQFAPYSVARFT